MFRYVGIRYMGVYCGWECNRGWFILSVYVGINGLDGVGGVY